MENELKTTRLNLVIAPSQVALIDAWRKSQDDLPSRSEAIRKLVELGLEADKNLSRS
jgi:Arc/MetJ-type ribon-helix-helix transcriptional regulator